MVQSQIQPGVVTGDAALFQYELEFTRIFRHWQNAPTAVRELKCLQFQFPSILRPIEPGDLFAGRISYGRIGISPEPGGLGYFCKFSDEDAAALVGNSSLTPERREEIKEMLAFWRSSSTSALVRREYPEWVAKQLPSDAYADTSAPYAGFPLYRMAGTQLDFERLLTLGIPGLKGLLACRANREETSDSQRELFAAMEGALELLCNCLLGYAEEADALLPSADEDQKADVRRMTESLRFLTQSAPVHFHQAIQLVWIYALLSGTWNYGRMDVYLAPFLANDLETGELTEEEAVRMIESLWRLIAAYDNQWNNRVIVGGRGRPDEPSADRFALLAIEATRRVLSKQPQLTLRFYKGQDPRLMDAALSCIGAGRTFPLLYNDDVNVPAVMQAFEKTEQEALDYLPFGCGEYIFWHRSVGTPSGTINLLTCLDLALRNGVHPRTGERLGPATGAVESMMSFDDVWRAWTAQVEPVVRALAAQQAIEYEVVGREASFLFISMLYDDCIERGRALLDGGVGELGGTLEAYGNINTADSLSAIRHLVFEKGKYTLRQIVQACDSNFEGCESLLNDLLHAPKFGNDLDDADEMAVRVHEYICEITRQQAPIVSLDSYMIVVINNNMNAIFGRTVGATPDGRRNGETMANANNPAPGRDVSGVMAFLHSLVKLDPSIHAGAVQNMKFSSRMFGAHRDKIASLLQGYFRTGGAQAMITVLDRDDLESAMREPEKWGHLMVRVGGFSARFIDLGRETQLDILRRTLYDAA